MNVKWIWAILICGDIFQVSAQSNLAPNYSFEDTVQCPTGFTQMYAIGWYSPTLGTPDYYNSCNSGIMGVPQNFLGWEPAKTGVAYAAIASRVNNNYREYIQTKLLDTLITGLSYHVSFFVSLADSSEYACNNIGAYFSLTAISTLNNYVLLNTPQIANKPSSNPLTIKNGWTFVTDTFTAAGGELYITIGNFNNAATSDTVFIGGKLTDQAYYYIDDVSVWTKDSLVGINENEKDLFKIYPNPSNGIFEIVNGKQQIENIEVSNVYGRKIYSHSFTPSIDLSSQPSGIYFMQIRSEQGVVVKKIIIRK